MHAPHASPQDCIPEFLALDRGRAVRLALVMGVVVFVSSCASKPVPAPENEKSHEGKPDDQVSDVKVDIERTLPEGMRVVSMEVVAVKVKVAPGTTCFILPNSRVDVIAVNRTGNEPSARVILQYMLVLDLDVHSTGDGDSTMVEAATVTLAATTEEAKQLELVMSGGSEIHLRLNHSDPPPSPDRGVKWSDLEKPTNSKDDK
jgi:Flp pilus assembly protein CpaB